MSDPVWGSVFTQGSWIPRGETHCRVTVLSTSPPSIPAPTLLVDKAQTGRELEGGTHALNSSKPGRRRLFNCSAFQISSLTRPGTLPRWPHPNFAEDAALLKNILHRLVVSNKILCSVSAFPPYDHHNQVFGRW